MQSYGKIYKIVPICMGEDGDVYIGSTRMNDLHMRFEYHLRSYDHYRLSGGMCKLTVHNLFNKYGRSNLKIKLLEVIDSSDVHELRNREADYIRAYDCVNKNIPGRTRKEYYVENQTSIKAYYQRNKERLKKLNRGLVKCECGCEVCKDSLSKHRKTNKHLNLMRE